MSDATKSGNPIECPWCHCEAHEKDGTILWHTQNDGIPIACPVAGLTVEHAGEMAKWAKEPTTNATNYVNADPYATQRHELYRLEDKARETLLRLQAKFEREDWDALIAAGITLQDVGEKLVRFAWHSVPNPTEASR